ncbi:MAG: glycogen debranching N-terminal domain-containing protein, partial [Terriglobales bacterium]
TASIFLINQSFLTEEEEVPAGSLAFTIARAVGNGICENFEITNYAKSKLRFNLEIAIRSDFADLFEVRWHKFYRRGRIDTVWDAVTQQLHMKYENGDFARELIYKILDCSTPAYYANGRIVFELEMSPSQTWRSSTQFQLLSNADDAAEHQEEQEKSFEQLQQRWIEEATKLTTSNEEFYRLFRQSVEDTGALRFYDHNFGSEMWIPAAGVPWYVTIFGRDSLFASLQNMIVNTKLAVGTLKELSSRQADRVDDFRNAEPGKIPHEVRFGELAHVGKVPNPNFATADATPLFLTVLHETWKWTGNEEILKTYRDNALRCLEWIDKYGDMDGDGFQEYKSRSVTGFENMCWKDSPDSIMYPDGTNVPQPKALCELQGYVFDAWLRCAEMFHALGDRDAERDLRSKAAKLQKQFEQAFWCDDIGFYALALDPSKRPVKTMASNAGHLLWSGICSKERAARVVAKLFEPAFYSG